MIDNESSLKFKENHEPLVVYTQKDLLRIFPFKRTKLQQLLNAGALPVVKVGRTYLSSNEMISRWLLENAGRTIYY